MAHPPKPNELSDDEDDQPVTGSAVIHPINPGSAAYVYQRIRDQESDDEESIDDDVWGEHPEDDFDDEDDIEGDAEEGEEEEEEGAEQMESVDHEDVSARRTFPIYLYLFEWFISFLLNYPGFYDEVLESLQRGYEEKIKGENLVLEINSSKFAWNVTMKELHEMVTKAILSLPGILNKVRMDKLFVFFQKNNFFLNCKCNLRK